MKNRVRALLIATLLIMSLIPSIAALFFATDAFSTQERIYKNDELSRVLQSTQDQLKRMSKVSPANEEEFKNLFEAIQDLKLIYGEDTFFSDKLKATLFKYFLISFGAYLIFALSIGVYLSGRIHKLYKNSYEELLEQRERSRYLAETARWQEVAKKMVHEIRRPLQPIKSWMSNLKLCYTKENKDLFRSLLEEADSAIEEEIMSLKLLVDEFSQFTDLPKPKRQPVDINDFLAKFVEHYKPILKNVSLTYKSGNSKTFCLIDTLLSRQVLTNLIENAIEANLGATIKVEISLRTEKSNVIIDVFNSGVPLTNEQRSRVFDLNFSTKENSKNKGLGLSIVKLIIVEQDGDIDCVKEDQGARFRFKFPLLSEEQNATSI